MACGMPWEHNFGDIGDDDGMVQRVVEQHEQHDRVTVVFLDGGAQGWGVEISRSFLGLYM